MKPHVNIFSISIIICLSVVGSTGLIKHIDYNGSHLIVVDSGSYAITGPILRDRRWASVTLTPKHAISYDVNCEREFHHNLTEIDLIKEKLEIVDEGSVAPGDRYCCTKFTLDDDAAFSSSGSLSYRFYQFGSITIQKRDGSHYSFISRDLKGVYARVFVLYDTVTFIDMGGKMDMRPKRCLESRELKLVHAAERYVQGSIHYPEPSIDNIF